jgi:uncharacterized iron-regulated membrane protein
MTATTTSTSSQEIALKHPYWVGGVVLIIISLILLGYSLGFLVRCGAGRLGICLDFSTHAFGTAALALFVVLFIVGILLLLYTGGATVTTSTTTPVFVTQPAVTVVPTQSAPPPASPTTVNVNPPPRNPPPAKP